MVGTILGPAASALQAQSLKLAVSASNIANADTDGYKAKETVFTSNQGGVKASVRPTNGGSVVIDGVESSNVNLDQEIVSSLEASHAYKASAALIGVQKDLDEALFDAVFDQDA